MFVLRLCVYVGVCMCVRLSMWFHILKLTMQGRCLDFVFVHDNAPECEHHQNNESYLLSMVCLHAYVDMFKLASVPTMVDCGTFPPKEWIRF